MILIAAQGLGRQYAGDPIFLDLAFEIRAGERIGLVGPNGAGKTTLLKLLDGIEAPEYGRIHVRPGIRISLLQQHPEFGPDQTLMDVARSGLASLLDLQRELEEAAQEMAEAEDQGDRERASRRYDELHEGWSTRTPTRSTIASRRSSTDCGLLKRTSTVQPKRSLVANSRG